MTDFYVDFGAAGGGNGTFATPWNRLTSITGASSVTGDKVWVRRTVFVDTATHANVNPPDGVPIIGWPKSGDEFYSTRPVAAQAAWDGDSEDYATVDFRDASQTTAAHRPCFSLTSARSYILHRLKVIVRPINGFNASYYHQACRTDPLTAVLIKLRNCWFEVAVPVANAMSSYVAGYWQAFCITNAQGGATEATYSAFDVDGCTFRSSVPTDGACYAPIGLESSTALTSTNSWALAPGFKNCVFDCAGYTGGWFGASGNVLAPSASVLPRLRTAFVDCIMQSDNCTQAQFHRWDSNADQSVLRTSFIRCKWTIQKVASSGNVGGLECQMSHYEDCEADGVGWINMSLRGSGNWRKARQRTPRQDGAFLLNYGRGSTVVFDNVTFQPGNSYDVSIPEAENNTVILRNVVQGTGGYRIVEKGRVIISDYDGLVGTWRSIMTQGELAADRAVRSGGAPFSVMMRPYGSAAPYGGGVYGKWMAEANRLSLARVGEEGMFADLTVGSRTVSIYGTFVGFSVAPTKDDIWLEMSYPTTSGRVLATSRVLTGGALTADGSSWSNVPAGHTRFRLDVSATIADACTGVLSVHTKYFEASAGRFYIDPLAVVT